MYGTGTGSPDHRVLSRPGGAHAPRGCASSTARPRRRSAPPSTPGRVPAAEELQIDLVDDRGRLQRVAGPFAPRRCRSAIRCSSPSTRGSGDPGPPDRRPAGDEQPGNLPGVCGGRRGSIFSFGHPVQGLTREVYPNGRPEDPSKVAEEPTYLPFSRPLSPLWPWKGERCIETTLGPSLTSAISARSDRAQGRRSEGRRPGPLGQGTGPALILTLLGTGHGRHRPAGGRDRTGPTESNSNASRG